MRTLPLPVPRPAPAGSYDLFGGALRRLLQEAGIEAPRRRFGWTALMHRGAPSGRMRRVQQYVYEHVGESLALDDLAAVAGLSRYHFARRFREEVGEPPWAFVRRTRAEAAVRLLEAGSPPAEAAQEAGFSDQPHLTRALHARYGRTPAQIRRLPSDDDGKHVQDTPPRAA